METNQRFYARRAAEELARAETAIMPAARERHLKLAFNFAQRANDALQTRNPSDDVQVRDSLGSSQLRRLDRRNG